LKSTPKFLALAASVAVLAAVAGTPAQAQQARDQIQVAGSSTVLPFSNVVAEQFGRTLRQFKTPIVASGGTGGGFREFCRGIGAQFIDVANASRAITPAELQTCRANGVTEIQEVRFGYDGIVFASHISATQIAFTTRQLYLGLAERVPQNGQLVANPFTRWNQVDPSLPNVEITAYIPGEKHGTREVFEERVMAAGCRDFPEIQAITVAADRTAACVRVRKDGRSNDIDGDYTETLARIERNRTAIGVFGLSFYDQNRDKIRVATVNNIVPSVEAIANGTYPVSRPLFFYVKKQHIGVIPGLKEFVEFFLSERMIGPDGMVTDKGLIPGPDAERRQWRERFTQGGTMGS
jgi:phosphate transport system substrate-binding protein